jgi:2-polyprenyl-3-methyl-5-hydroxy-6-metoxy-1,4-benzoquinol methylase
MLQMLKMARNAQSELELLTPFPPLWKTMEELEYVTNGWMQRWLSKRSNMAQKHGLFARFSDYVDKIARTDLPEHTDNPDVSPERKLKIVRSLHRTNFLLGVYRRYIKILTPLIMEVATIHNRPARLLELASGSGEMAMNLARLASKENLPVEVTGSDYVKDLVKDAEEKAVKRGLGVHFRTINAFDMGVLSHGQYDIFLVIGTMHHFTPGQLAVIMAQSRKFAGSAFVGIDGYRSMSMLLWIPIFHLITFLPDHIHDAWLTARKFYTLFELKCIAQIAVPGVKIAATHSFPGISVLKARF